MKTLELQYLAPYLPYRLKIRYGHNIVVMNTGQGSSKNWIGIGAVIKRQGYQIISPFPILRTLAYLNKEIEHNGESFTPIHRFYEMYGGGYSSFESYYDIHWIDFENPLKCLQYVDVLKLFEWHFDVFGLIDAGLAININTLNK